MNKDSVSSPTEATRPVTSVTMTTTTAGVVTSKTTPTTTTVTTSSDQLEVCTTQPQLKQQTQLTIATVTPNSGSISISPNPSPTTTPTTPSTTPSPTISTVSPAPATQQFTVHSQFINGVHSHTGPAPNVTVNPHYQPEAPPTSPVLRPNINAPNAADQQIRVLTPSEIMRTLPSLCQDTYDMPVSQITVRFYIQQRQNFYFFIIFMIDVRYFKLAL